MWGNPKGEEKGVTKYNRAQFARWSLHMYHNQTPAFGPEDIRKLVKQRMVRSMDDFVAEMTERKTGIPGFFDLNKQYYEYEANIGSLNFEVWLN